MEIAEFNAEIARLLQVDHQAVVLDGADGASRFETLLAAEREGLAFATPDRGFFIYPLRNAVSQYLLRQYAEVRAAYLLGTVELDDVREAFTAWLKSTRRVHFVHQLEGSIYNPKADGKRAGQAEVQAAFEGGADSMRRVRRKVTTPQVDMQPDQMERATIYFGISEAEYALGRANY